MENITSVIFDMDGVIFDSESIWKKHFIIANKKFDINLTEQYRMSICGKTEPVIRKELKQLLPGYDVDAYREYIVKGVNDAIFSGDFDVKPGFDTLVNFLRENNFKIALATSSSRQRAKRMFEQKGYNITELFDAFVFGDEPGVKSKPDPFLFTTCASRLNEPCQHCIVVEDSINGIIAAVNGGFVPVMAEDLIPPDEYCIKNCKYIIHEND